MKRAMPFLAALALLFVAIPLFADSVAAHWLEPSVTTRDYPNPPLRTASHGAAGNVVASLGALSDIEILSMRQWNNARRSPMKVGVERRLENVLTVGGEVSAASNEPFHWRGTLHADGSSRLRVKLTNVHASPDTIFWVYGTDGDAIGFDASLAYDGVLWTPSVEGDTITVEVESPAHSPASFTIESLSDIRRPTEVAPTGEECIQDITCYSGWDQLQTTIAHMYYQSGGSGYICSGGLVADMALTGTPYFFTANHCISTQAEASTLETFWDYKTASCDGPDPSLSGLRHVTGSTLVSTTHTQDMTLLRLSSLPGGTRYFLGWTSARPAVGVTLYRISHPDGQPQRLSTANVETTSSECQDTSRTNFLYSKPVLGAVIGGSSGSPTMNDQAQIVGTLTGGCPGGVDPCGTTTRTIDGAFSTAYTTYFKPYLNPTTGGCSACTPNANTACLLGNRFKATLTWNDPFAHLSGNGSIIKYAENQPEINPTYGPLSEIAFFSMYSTAPKSIETIVRMIKGQNINNKYWVFLTGFASAEYTVTVQDTTTCTTWTRNVPAGSSTMIKDFDAFPFP